CRHISLSYYQQPAEEFIDPRGGHSNEPFLKIRALFLGIPLIYYLHACDLDLDLKSLSLNLMPPCDSCLHPHARDLESLLTISPSIYALPLDRFNNVVSFEEELAHQKLRKTLTHALELSSCIYLDDRAWGLEF
nr:hypothetical protein [Tanacetum cinerariifolium]